MPWQESACGDADPSGEGPAWHWEDLRGFRRVDPTTFLLNVKMDHKLFFRGTLLSNTFVFGIVGVFKENGIYIYAYIPFSGFPKYRVLGWTVCSNSDDYPFPGFDLSKGISCACILEKDGKNTRT